MSLGSFSLGHIEPWTSKHHIEIHSIDTNTWVILDAQINVFLDSKTKVSYNKVGSSNCTVWRQFGEDGRLIIIFFCFHNR